MVVRFQLTETLISKSVQLECLKTFANLGLSDYCLSQKFRNRNVLYLLWNYIKIIFKDSIFYEHIFKF